MVPAPPVDVEGCVRRAASRGLTVAVAESLTAGQVCARLADVPGASAVLRGGAVTYATDVKSSLLGVPASLLDQHGPVHPDVASAMASGVRGLLGADVGLAPPGVAGPGPADGHPAGTVHVAAAWAGGRRVVSLSLPGERAQVQAHATDAALRLLSDVLDDSGAPSADIRR